MADFQLRLALQRAGQRAGARRHDHERVYESSSDNLRTKRLNIKLKSWDRERLGEGEGRRQAPSHRSSI